MPNRVAAMPKRLAMITRRFRKGPSSDPQVKRWVNTGLGWTSCQFFFGAAEEGAQSVQDQTDQQDNNDQQS